MVAGTNMLRIMKASTKIALAIPKPNAFTIKISADINEKQTRITMVAALVMIRLLYSIPQIVLLMLSLVFSYSSLILDNKKTS